MKSLDEFREEHMAEVLKKILGRNFGEGRIFKEITEEIPGISIRGIFGHIFKRIFVYSLN